MKIERIEIGDALYPQKLIDRLGKNAPKFLYYTGDIELLALQSVGISGSRNPTEKSLSKYIVKRTCYENKCVISGYAKGIDEYTDMYANYTGVGIINVLPYGLKPFEYRYCGEDYRPLFISQFEPDAKWQAWQAMKRNEVIVALSDKMYCIEPSDKGGTLNAGETALKLGVPLQVYGSGAGYEKLIKKGAKPIVI